MAQFDPSFGVAIFAPRPSRALWTYATCGMADERERGGPELHLFSKDASPLLVELLTIVAHYHRTGASLGLHHTVDFGRPWLPESQCDHGFISLPYLDGPKLEVQHPSGETRHLWLIPVTASERAFKRTHGAEALEQRFESAQFDYADPQRHPVA